MTWPSYTICFLVSISLLVLSGCEPFSPSIPDFPGNIEQIHISLSDGALEELQSQAQIQLWRAAYIEEHDSIFPAQIRIHGNISRRFIKKSYQCELYSTILPRKVIDGVVFSGQLTDASFCRYRLADYFFRRAGCMTAEAKPVILDINGDYQGLYLRIERIDEHFLRRRGLPLSSVYKSNWNFRFSCANGILPQQQFSKQLPSGDETYTDLAQLLSVIDRGVTENTLQNLEQWLDIENTLRYIAVCRIVAHLDGVTNNIILYYNPHIRKFQFIPWDFDQTFITGLDSLPLLQNNLFEQLIRIPSCHDRINHITKELFSLNDALQVLDSLYQQTSPLCDFDPYNADGISACERSLEHTRSFLRQIDRILYQR